LGGIAGPADAREAKTRPSRAAEFLMETMFSVVLCVEVCVTEQVRDAARKAEQCLVDVESQEEYDFEACRTDC